MSVAIVVPCFNEAARWNATYWDVMFTLPGTTWVLVDDGSTDGTAALLRSAAGQSNVRALIQPRNAGKAEAVRRGMADVLADDTVTAVGYMDADGAFNAQDVEQIISVFSTLSRESSQVDAVWSSRVALAGRDIRRSTSRHYIGRVVATFISIGQSQIPYDTQSGLKLFVPSESLARCLSERFRTRWLFEIELLARWQRETGREMAIWEEPLSYWHDVPGSKVRGGESLRIIRELAIVKAEQRKARRG